MDKRPPARRVDPDEVPPPNRRAGASAWADYADGEWWCLNTTTNTLFANVMGDPMSNGRTWASRNGFRFESRPGPIEAGAAPVLYYVRMTRKDAKP